MSANPMIEEVDRLLGDRLAAGGEVFLPGMGSLYVERLGARRVSRRKLTPPSRRVVFTDKERGESLVGVIAVAAACSDEEAQAIYESWKAAAASDDRIVVEGVGRVEAGLFTPDPGFDQRLNPQGHAPVKVPVSQRDWVLWAGIAAIVFAALFGGYQFLMLYSDSSDAVRVDRVAERTVEAGRAVQSADAAAAGASTEAVVPATDTTAAATGAPQAGTPASGAPQASAAVSQPAGTPEAPAALQPGRRYVVVGVFSTPENAARAEAGLREQNAGGSYGVYRFYDKYMLTVFETTDAAAAERFRREHEADYPGVWVYRAR